jgi:hypothetical protein
MTRKKVNPIPDSGDCRSEESMSILEIISVIVSIVACTLMFRKLFNILQARERRRVAELVSRAFPEPVYLQDSSLGQGVPGVEGVRPVDPVAIFERARIRMGSRSESPKAKSADRYELLKKKEPEKDSKVPAKGRSRYDLLKNKE